MGDGQVIGAAMAQAFALLGRRAVYQAAPGAPVVAVTVLDEFRDNPPALLGSRVSAPAWKIEALASEIAARPRPGAVFVLEDGPGVMVRSAQIAAAGLTYLCDCDTIVPVTVPATRLEPLMLPMLVGPVWMA